jgi:hypothetical protein
MSATHHRTWQHFHIGHINITVQLDSTAEHRSVERHQELAGVARQLIDTMNAEHLPVTWAVSDPAHSAATSTIIKSSVEHELAILGGSNWVGPTAGRTRFARELVRRVTQARCAGLSVTTFVPAVASVDGQIDLVVKQQITALAGVVGSAVHVTNEPRALHYQVWEVPVTAKLPLPSAWFGSGKRALLRRIEQTASEAGTFHLLIDAAELAANSRRDDATITWIMNRLATLRNRGLVQIETLRATTARLSDVPAISPQRSILRGVA